MGAGVGRVGKLVQVQVLVIAGQQLLGPLDCPRHALGAGGEDEPGAIGPEKRAPLNAHGVGHYQDQGNAVGGGGHGQADAGIAAGGLD